MLVRVDNEGGLTAPFKTYKVSHSSSFSSPSSRSSQPPTTTAKWQHGSRAAGEDAACSGFKLQIEWKDFPHSPAVFFIPRWEQWLLILTLAWPWSVCVCHAHKMTRLFILKKKKKRKARHFRHVAWYMQMWNGPIWFNILHLRCELGPITSRIQLNLQNSRQRTICVFPRCFYPYFSVITLRIIFPESFLCNYSANPCLFLTVSVTFTGRIKAAP